MSMDGGGPSGGGCCALALRFLLPTRWGSRHSLKMDLMAFYLGLVDL